MIKIIEYMSGIVKFGGLKMLDISRVFPLRLRYMIVNVITFIVFLFLPKQRKAVKRNLKLILQRNPKYNNVLKVFTEYGRYWAELPDLNKFWKDTQKVYHGEFPPKEKFFLGVTYHIGNFEIFGNEIFKAYGDDFQVIAERLKPQFLSDYFAKKRAEHHIKQISHDDIREILKVFKNKGPLGVVCDRVIEGQGIETRIFGRRIKMPLTIVQYAITHKIPIYIAYCVKEDKQLKIISQRIDDTLSFPEAVHVISSALESALKRYPYQWHVLSDIIDG